MSDHKIETLRRQAATDPAAQTELVAALLRAGRLCLRIMPMVQMGASGYTRCSLEKAHEGPHRAIEVHVIEWREPVAADERGLSSGAGLGLSPPTRSITQPGMEGINPWTTS